MDFDRWLDPTSRQPDGSLWPRDFPPVSRVIAPLTPLVSRRVEPSSDPFLHEERKFLRLRLLTVERSRAGLSGGLHPGRLVSSGGEVTCDTVKPALRAMIDRGLMTLTVTMTGPRCLFTYDGLAALRAFFERQPTDFRVLFPRLHHELGLGHLVNPP